ncbi:HPr family phosphocarrier protein [candidate division TA06 bacterium]|nr:HPr family phosphocarrier protein [candidate division TA06 bacterium]
MIERKVVIRNQLGLHARPAALFVKKASRYLSRVTISKDGIEVNGKSILGILMLACEKGSRIILKVEGEDEKKCFKELLDLVKEKFDEE